MKTARELLLGSGNRLKLGVFSCNGLAGVGTTVPERFVLNWRNSLDVATVADRLGFEAIVPYARFRSPLSPSHSSGFIYENFTWASAIAARTQRAAVMSTVHVTNVHPVFAAKAMTTIDHVSDGRFGLNIVCGWLKEEAEMFGTEAIGHDDRYAYADEWITAIKRLWTDEEEFDFDGRFIKVKRGQAQPKPLQKPWPVLMNAATSPKGKAFVADHCDIAFVVKEDLGQMRDDVASYHAAARAGDRRISVWSFCAIIQGDTDAEARALADRYADHADHAYINCYFNARAGASAADVEPLKRGFAMGGNGIKIIGSAKSIADQLEAIAATGIDGLLLTWVNYQDGIRRFGKTVLPLLEARGLRNVAPSLDTAETAGIGG